jgi:hypothetical protein
MTMPAGSTQPHVEALTLRRLYAGEEVAPELAAAVAAHMVACSDCRDRLEVIAREEWVSREPTRLLEARRRRHRLLGAVGVVGTAVVAIAVFGAGRLSSLTRPERFAGSAELEVMVARASAAPRGASSDPSSPEPIAEGELVRLGLRPGSWRFALVLIVDQRGVVTPIAAAGNHSLALPARSGTMWLPASLEFTGKGIQRVVALFTNAPLRVDETAAQLRARALATEGALERLEALNMPGEHIHRTFLTP